MENHALDENRDFAHSWDVIELASRGDQLTGQSLFGMDSSAFHRRFASEVAQGRAEFETSLRQLTDEIASLEGAEAIYWEKYLLSVVRVTRIKVSTSSVVARVEVIPRVTGAKEDRWRVGCSWPEFHAEALLWTSNAKAPIGGFSLPAR